ncbi:FYVE and coiled-coil domain-containing protein 1-like isoform X2 [Mobula hypostoma]|uniref:FYVE and coiled-coil domain-containing protein 1-like isoform X2 n=1 Tax=Mobula hypostoma TaxID=723540 RepID=UPI002FC388F2
MAAQHDAQLLPVIRDLYASIQELCEHQGRDGRPITDGVPALHKLCTKLEYLLQYDQKEKKSILGTRKGYWDYFCVCFGDHKYGMKVLKFVNDMLKLNTSLGKGRAFIRFCLVQQQLADSIQFCFHNKNMVRLDIVEHLYALNEVTFELPLIGVDLDMSWPIARWESKSHRSMTKASLNHSECQVSERDNGVQGIHCPTGERDTETDKFKTFTRILRRVPWNSFLQELSKKTGHDPAEVTEGAKESRKANVGGVVSGEAETASTSDIDNRPPGGQILTLKTAESASSPEQLPQCDHDAPGYRCEARAAGVHPGSDSPGQASEGNHLGGPREGQGDLTTLAVGKDREGELSKQAERQVMEELRKALQEKEHVIKELQELLQEMTNTKAEGCSNHQQEIAAWDAQEESAERLRRLEDSNRFLNETVEEMDSMLDGLRQALASKEQEVTLLRMEKLAAAEQVDVEEGEGLKVELGGQREVCGETEPDHHCDSEESELSFGWSGKVPESAEMENLQSKLQCLESLNKSLEDKYHQSQQQVRELEMSVVALQSEVSRLQGSKLRPQDSTPPPDRCPREAGENLEREMRGVQTESEALDEQQVEREDLAREEAPLSYSLAAMKPANQQAQEKISELDQQLVRYRAGELSRGETTNITAKNDQSLNILKGKLEEIILKIEREERPNIDIKLAEALAQLHLLTAEQIGMENGAAESEDQAEIPAEEETPQDEDTKVEYSLQEAVLEGGPTQRKPECTSDHQQHVGMRKPFSQLSTPDRSAQFERQMEELENRHRQAVWTMEERIESLRAEREAMECQTVDLEKQVQTLEEDLLQLRDTVGRLELENRTLQGELQEARAAAELCAQTLEQADAEAGQRREEDMAGWMLPAVAQLLCTPQEEEESVSTLHNDCNSRMDGTGVMEEKMSSRDAEVNLLVASLAQAKVAEEELRGLLKEAQEDAKSREEESRVLKEMVVSLKERTVELLREKDLLWQKAEKMQMNTQPDSQKASLRRNPFGSKKWI